MNIDLHDACVPVFLRYLAQLTGLLDAAEAHARARHLAAAELLDARLAPDMYTFDTQIQIAANFALRTCFPLAGRAIPPYGDFPATFDGLRSRIARTVALIRSLAREEFQHPEARMFHSEAGKAKISLEAPHFLLHYALPNFFFHVTTAYAILRSRGVAIGKEQFDGFHSYPPNIAVASDT